MEFVRQERRRQIPGFRSGRPLVRRGCFRGGACLTMALARGGALHRRLGARPYRLISVGRPALSQGGPVCGLSDHARPCAVDRGPDCPRNSRRDAGSQRRSRHLHPRLRRHSDGRKRPRARSIDAATITVAVANSLVIAIYSVIDGEGARIAGPAAPFAFAYNAWAHALTALAYGPVVVFLRGRTVPIAFVSGWRRGLASGLAAFAGYATAIWATPRRRLPPSLLCAKPLSSSPR